MTVSHYAVSGIAPKCNSVWRCDEIESVDIDVGGVLEREASFLKYGRMACAALDTDWRIF